MTDVATQVVGSSFAGKDASSKIYRMTPGTPLRLEREPGNKHDRNAVAVYVNRSRVGYLPATVAASVASIIDGGQHSVEAVRSRGAGLAITVTYELKSLEERNPLA